MDSKSKISVVDIEAIGTLIHGSITPLRSFLSSNLPTFIKKVTVTIFHVMQLHVGLVQRWKQDFRHKMIQNETKSDQYTNLNLGCAFA